MKEAAYEVKKRANNAYVVCQSCGDKHGAGISAKQKQKSLCTWHTGKCDICLRRKQITEFRDFGFSKYQWGYEESIQSDNKGKLQ